MAYIHRLLVACGLLLGFAAAAPAQNGPPAPGQRLKVGTRVIAPFVTKDASGALEGGMAPKAESCLVAVDGGVPSAHILDGRVPHVLLLELLTDTGIGTMITPGLSRP